MRGNQYVFFVEEERIIDEVITTLVIELSMKVGDIKEMYLDRQDFLGLLFWWDVALKMRKSK